MRSNSVSEHIAMGRNIAVDVGMTRRMLKAKIRTEGKLGKWDR